MRIVNRAFHSVGGQWFGKLPSRQTPTHLQAARTPDHEDGAPGRDARHVLHERIKGNQATIIFSGQIDEFMFDLSVKSDDIQALLQRNDRSFTWFSKSSLMKVFSHLPRGLGHLSERNRTPENQQTICYPNQSANIQETLL